MSTSEKSRASSPSESSASSSQRPEWLEDLTRRQLEEIDRSEARVARMVPSKRTRDYLAATAKEDGRE